MWDTDQICMLFDSLMRGYPFGSFLFWKVKPENSGKYVFYDFVREYHERDSPYPFTGSAAATAPGSHLNVPRTPPRGIGRWSASGA